MPIEVKKHQILLQVQVSRCKLVSIYMGSWYTLKVVGKGKLNLCFIKSIVNINMSLIIISIGNEKIDQMESFNYLDTRPRVKQFGRVGS